MPVLNITLPPEQEASLRHEYDRFCELLINTVPSSSAPSFEQFVVGKLTGNTGEIAEQMVDSIIKSGAYQYLDRWFKGLFGDFVMTLFRRLRMAGYGFVRGEEISDETLTKGAVWLLDAVESDLNMTIPPAARQQIIEEMPRSAYQIDTLYPNESIRRLFTTADRYLQDCHAQYSQTFDERHLDKADLLFDFMAGFPEWQGEWADDWQRRFQYAREEIRQRREFQMTWVDRLLKRIVKHRESILSH